AVILMSPGPTPACSSRCTAVHRTSPVPDAPTRPRPCSRWRCCSTISATVTRPGGWRRRWPSTWPPGVTPSPAPPRRSAAGSPRWPASVPDPRLVLCPTLPHIRIPDVVQSTVDTLDEGVRCAHHPDPEDLDERRVRRLGQRHHPYPEPDHALRVGR